MKKRQYVRARRSRLIGCPELLERVVVDRQVRALDRAHSSVGEHARLVEQRVDPGTLGLRGAVAGAAPGERGGERQQCAVATARVRRSPDALGSSSRDGRLAARRPALLISTRRWNRAACCPRRSAAHGANGSPRDWIGDVVADCDLDPPCDAAAGCPRARRAGTRRRARRVRVRRAGRPCAGGATLAAAGTGSPPLRARRRARSCPASRVSSPAPATVPRRSKRR